MRRLPERTLGVALLVLMSGGVSNAPAQTEKYPQMAATTALV